jgi:uncharacterized protein YbaP (TraB family)
MRALAGILFTIIVLACARNSWGCELLLYQIRIGDRESHLLGTNHVSSLGGCGFEKEIELLLSDTVEIFFESSRWQQSAGTRQNDLIEALKLPAGASLHEVLDERELDQLRLSFSALSLPPDAVERMRGFRPSLVALILLTSGKGLAPDIAHPSTVGNQALSLDSLIKRSLSGKEIAVSAMEDVASFRLVFEMDVSEERLILQRVMKVVQSTQLQLQLRSMADLVTRKLHAGDVHGAVDVQKKLYTEVGLLPLLRVLLERRNHHFASRIVAETVKKNKRVFVVGSLHLGGTDGILCSISKAGGKISMKDGSPLEATCP